MGDLGRVDVEIEPGVVVQDGEALHDGVADDVRAAPVHQPGEAVGQCDHRGRAALAAQFGGQVGALVGAASARQRQRMGPHPARGGGWLVGPDRVQRVAFQGLEGDPAARQPGLDLADLVRGMQPGVETDHRVGGGVRLQPVGGLRRRPVDRRERLQRDLVADLQRIATVDEHPGDVRQHDAEPGRAGEAGQPFEPCVPRADVFALMRIRARHHEAVEPPRRQFLPEPRQTRRAIRGAGRGGEGLKHDGFPRVSIRWRPCRRASCRAAGQGG